MANKDYHKLENKTADQTDREGTKNGFTFLNITQFMGAGNDNVLKQVLIFGVATGGIWSGVLGKGAQAYASLALAIPFVVFSGFAGQFSDRFSKRDVCVFVKLTEVAIAMLALIGLWLVNLWLVLSAMVLISVQSAFFTPAKFGILPEIVDSEKLSQANGTINMFTYIAIILGGAIGGPIYDLYAPNSKATPLVWLPGVVILFISILGAIASFGIPRVKPANPSTLIKPVFFKTYFTTWKTIRGTALHAAIVSWSVFYMIVGGIAILIIPDYKDLLGISATKAAILMAVLGISIGIGDFVAGRLSSHGIRTSLIPVGAFPVTVMFFMLAFLPLQFSIVLFALSLTGFLAGFVMVPLQTLTQHLAPDEVRGQVLGLWNCLSFVGIILGNIVFLIVKQTGISSHRVFLVCGIMSVVFLILHYSRWNPLFNASLKPVREKANR